MTRAAIPLLVVLFAALAPATDGPKTGLKTEAFDKDPGWEGVNNRVPAKPRTVVQDFGYSPTTHAGRAKGEIGGKITRAATPAYYGAKVSKTLDDKFSASGTFAFTHTSPGAGVFFGWFAADQPGGGGRPIGSLGLHFDGEGAGARLAVRLITGTNKSCGTFVTPFLPGKFRPTPIRRDGTRYSWTLDYDPAAADGRGRFTFTIRSHGEKPEELAADRLPADLPATHRAEALRRFPNTTRFSVDLPPGYKADGAKFDHFGLMNMMKPGGHLSVYFGDLTLDGKAENFTGNTRWDGSGNRVEYQDRVLPGAHDFGFSNTHFAGGKAGEVGGDLWRSGKYAYYADKVGPLSLDDRLEARGRVVLKVGAPDADVFLGWFNTGGKDTPPVEAGNFLGIHVGGPTRVGHYFHPALTTAKGTRALAEKGPVLVPGKVYDWSLVYDPTAGGGNGSIAVTLGKESVTLPLKPGWKAEGAGFDRFGLFNSNIGGQLVRIYLDDLTYTAGRK